MNENEKMASNIVVFDTETTSLEKPFCYNIGYVIVNPETSNIILRRDFVVEQVWHNPMLFSTAYYASKRPIYVERMRRHSVVMNKFGYICQQMIRDFKASNVARAFAFNSDFDEKVFDFNCEWFKCNNPFDNVPISDIRGFAHQFIVNDVYRDFCEEHKYFTESGNYSTSAETMFRYVASNLEFEEEHTALADSEIEWLVLWHCLENGAELNGDYKAKRSIPRLTEKTFTVKKNGEIVYETNCYSITYRKSADTVILRQSASNCRR